MHSIPQSFLDILYELLKSNDKAKELLINLNAPMTYNHSSLSYATLISYTDALSKQMASDLIKLVLEKMDEAFHNSKNRTERYYVNHYRERTIITLFGPVTYKRHEYKDRTTGKPFIYVDREIGLLERQRYDICVCALAYEMYSNQNSMIKVGKLLGERIYPFTLEHEGNRMAIPRQTIFNMNNRFKIIKAPEPRREETPDTIYIMADEKYIHLQGERTSEDDKNKRYYEMTKLGVIFTGREECLSKTGKPLKHRRWKLTGKHILTSPRDSSNFWSNTLDTLNNLYDLTKVKKIYILGDGAPWIKAGVTELKIDSSIKVKYALDRFHLKKAIHKLTKDKDIRNKLYDYAIHGSKKDLIKTIDAILPIEERTDAISQQIDYILNNLSGAHTMFKEVQMGCAMEQAIQHILASNFTSVPKAYGKQHLHTYVNARTLQQNDYNMSLTYIQVSDVSKDLDEIPDTIDLSKETIDLSFFDNMSSNPYYTLHLNDSNYRQITKF